VRDYLLTLLVAAAVTYVLTPVVRRFAIMVGAIKQQPRERDVHTAPVPLIGGVAMYLGLAAALLVANQIPQLHDSIAGTGMISGLLLAGGLVVVIGFIDDRWGMNALTKAAGQVAAGGILVATGAQLNWLPMPGGGGHFFVPTPDQQTLLTILIVVATINAVNMIDGLDGLAAGIVAIAAMSFFAYYYSLTKLAGVSSLASPALASAVLIGICLGFLPHNFSPAKIFMGDTGAMLLGLVLAYAPIEGISSTDPGLLQQYNRYPLIMPLLLPVVLLVIPYGDMLLAIVRRTRAGQSPFVADRKHLHHRLLDIGHSQRASVLIMYLWAAAFSGSVVWLSITRTELPRAQNHHGEPVLVFVLVTAAAIVVLVVLSMPWRRRSQQAVDGPRAAGNAAGGATAVAGSAASASGSELVAAASRARSASEAVHPAAVAGPGAGWRLASSRRDDEQVNGASGERTARGWSADDQDGHGRQAQHLRPGGDDYPPADEAGAGNGLTATGRWLPANGDGPSVIGTPPPADDSDWGWFRPAAADESDQGPDGGG
jgi:UDP-GlcNAc:undecaprenyl-phosphate GlcNAc-1-phosphate transferase